MLYQEIYDFFINSEYNLIEALIAGMLASIVFTVTYKFQKNSEKYNMLSILDNEIERNAEYFEQHLSIRVQDYVPRIPSIKIYDGLLSSGNIKYFDKQLQCNLDDLYYQFSENSPSSNKDIASDVRQELDYLKHRNNYFGVLFWLYRRKK